MTTYKEYKEKRHARVNALPLHFAFSDEQFDRLCEKLNATADDFYSGPAGCLYLKKDAPIIHAYLDEPDELDELMQNYEFAKEAFLYEMGNHEYHINWQGDYDVISCFVAINYDKAEREGYLAQTGWSDTTVRAYKDAQREFYRLCDQNDWW